jgi:hypothetical protein
LAIGSVKNVVVCVPSTSSTSASSIVCPNVNGQKFLPERMNAYLIDANQQANFDAALGQFDYVHASGLWAFAFSTVVGLYFVSHGIGLALGMIRRG